MVFLIYVNIILIIKFKGPRVVVKSTRGVMSLLKGKMKGASKEMTNNTKLLSFITFIFSPCASLKNPNYQ
jgi:hypothetical protein